MTVSTAVVGTISALVIGLLISSASASFSLRSREIQQMAADVVQLDRTLRRLGDGATDTLNLLHAYAAVRTRQIDSAMSAPGDSRAEVIRQAEELQDRILALSVSDERQRWLQAEALKLAGSVVGMRTLLTKQEDRTIPISFRALVICWLSIVFGSFGLFAPRNLTAMLVPLVCALAVSSGIVMILEMDTPLTGLVQVSMAPVRNALEEVR